MPGSLENLAERRLGDTRSVVYLCLMKWSRSTIASASLASLLLLHCFGDDPAFVPPSSSSSDGGGVEGPETAVPSGKTLWMRAWPDADYLVRVAVDAGGNTFIVGSQAKSVVLDSVLVPKGGYVLCLSPDGSVLWAKAIDGSLMSVTIDPSRSFIYATGLIGQPGAAAAAFSLGEAKAAAGAMFVIKIDTSTGAAVWANSIALEGDASEAWPYNIATNGREVAVAGHFKGTSLAITSGGARVTSTAERAFDGFVAAFSAENGQGRWVTRIGGTGDTADTSVITEGVSVFQASGNSEYFLVAGTMLGDAITATTGGTELPLPGKGSSSNALVARLDAANGTVAWAQLNGGSATLSAHALTSGPAADSIVVGGQLSGQVDFGTDIASATPQGYLHAIDGSNRTTRWAKVVAGCQSTIEIQTDDAGELMMLGSISQSGFALEGIAVEGQAAATTKGAFMAKWRSSGELLWLRGYGMSGSTGLNANGMAAMRSGESRIVGMADGAFLMNPDGDTPVRAIKGGAFVIALAP